MGCARPPADGSPRPDARPTRSPASAGTPACARWNGTPGRPIRPVWQGTRSRGQQRARDETDSRRDASARPQIMRADEFTVTWCRRLSQAQAVRMVDEITIAPSGQLVLCGRAARDRSHLLGRHQNSRRVMVRERWAWRWARQHALIWTATVDRRIRDDLAWYAVRAAKIDRDQHLRRLSTGPSGQNSNTEWQT